MNNGGREALLHYLLHFDLTTVDLRVIPKTAALLDQKIASLNAEKGWLLDLLGRGKLPWGCDCRGACPTQRLFDRYITHANRQGTRRRAIETQIGIFLSKHVPSLRKVESSFKFWNRNKKVMEETTGSVYKFPPLSECRAAFAKMIQQDFDWDGPEEWTEEPPPDAPDDGIF
jgi:hypothetical protein